MVMSLQDFELFLSMEDTGYYSAGYIFGLHWWAVQEKWGNGKWVHIIQILGNQCFCLRVTPQQVCGKTPPWKELKSFLNLLERQTVIVHKSDLFFVLINCESLCPTPYYTSVFREGTEHYYFSLGMLAFQSSHKSRQAVMRWFSLSSEGQLSFKSMVP